MYTAARCYQIILMSEFFLQKIFLTLFVDHNEYCFTFYCWWPKTVEGLIFDLYFPTVLDNTLYACQVSIKLIEVAFVLKSLSWTFVNLSIHIFSTFLSNHNSLILYNFINIKIFIKKNNIYFRFWCNFLYRNYHADEDLKNGII